MSHFFGGDLIMMVEQESFLLACSEAEAGIEIVADAGDVGQIEVQVALTCEMSLTSHLHEHTNQVSVFDTAYFDSDSTLTVL